MKLDQVHCEHMQYSLSRKRGGGGGGVICRRKVIEANSKVASEIRALP